MTKTILNVQGMSCSSCIAHVEEALRRAGASAVRVELQRGTVSVMHDPRIPEERLVSALEDAGYGATPRTGCCCG